MIVLGVPEKQIRANFNDRTIRVYQAYNQAIATSAVEAGRFVTPPFKMERMTWIKPSFLWMMYRCGWAQKDSGQSNVLAIDISREGFEWAIENSCLSHRPNGMNEHDWAALKSASPVRIQWDPERDINIERLEHRSIQIGLTGVAVNHYVKSWIKNVTDITDQVAAIRRLVKDGKIEQATSMLPEEKAYPLSAKLYRKLGVEV